MCAEFSRPSLQVVTTRSISRVLRATWDHQTLLRRETRSWWNQERAWLILQTAPEDAFSTTRMMSQSALKRCSVRKKDITSSPMFPRVTHFEVRTLIISTFTSNDRI